MQICRLGPDYLLTRGGAGAWERIYALSARLQRDYLSRLLTDRGTTDIVDVGANDGRFSAELREDGFEGHLLSFEPAPGPYVRLQARAEQDDQWEAHPVALGHRLAEVGLNVTRATGFCSILAPNALARTIFSEGTEVLERVKIEMRRLDDFAPALLPGLASRRVFLKVDTQGYDLNVLRGGERFLEVVDALKVELSASPLYEGAPDRDTVIGYLRDKGFEMLATFPATWDPRSAQVLEYDGIFARVSSDVPA